MKTLLFFVFAAVSAADFFHVSVFAQKIRIEAPKQIVSKPSAGKTIVTQTLSAVEKAVLDEINAARKDPKKYAEYLEDYKKLYKGNTVYLPNFLRIQTNEGTAVVDEAIGFMKSLAPLAPYKFSDGLNKAAGAHIKDLMIDFKIGHKGRDGSLPSDRISRFGKWGGRYAENISYFTETARDIVLNMIIDDGYKSRAHRRNVFSPEFKLVGIGFGKGKTGEGLCVVVFTDSYIEGNQKSGRQEF